MKFEGPPPSLAGKAVAMKSPGPLGGARTDCRWGARAAIQGLRRRPKYFGTIGLYSLRRRCRRTSLERRTGPVHTIVQARLRGRPQLKVKFSDFRTELERRALR